MKILTQRQDELLRFIAQSIRAGRSPLIAELIEQMKVARESSLTDLLRPLERKGYITIQGGVRGRQRIIDLTPKGKVAAQVGLPVVGSIVAGPLHETLQEAVQVVETLEDAFAFRPGDFFLEVVGDSMIGDGILPGDKVLLRPNIPPQNGEIAAVQMLGQETQWTATLKHVFHHPGQAIMTLRASNPCYEDVSTPTEQVHVAGVYRGLLRNVI